MSIALSVARETILKTVINVCDVVYSQSITDIIVLVYARDLIPACHSQCLSNDPQTLVK